MIQTKGFYINYSGDMSVGMFPVQWVVEGEFFFDSPEEMEEFKIKLRETWEYCSDTPIGVETFEERTERLNKQEEQLKQS